MSDNYLDIYRGLMMNSGHNIGESLTNTLVRKINDSFADSPAYRIIKLDGVDVEVRVTQISEVSYVERLNNLNKTDVNFIFRPYTKVMIGSIVEWNDYTWLVVDVNWDDIVPKAEAVVCNKILEVVVGEDQVVQGYDQMYRPIFENTPIIFSAPCVARNLLSNTALGDAVNVPHGNLHIQIKYSEDCPIEEGHEFTMSNAKYKITSLGTNKVYNRVGILSILSQRIP
jgi:hypothetical protein